MCAVFFAAWPAVLDGRGAGHAQPSPAANQSPLLEVLRETGGTRDQVPVLDSHPDAARYVSALTRGMSGRLLRLYALEQHYLQAKKGATPEPAYLLLSNRMGGFPRFGFYLGSRDKRAAGYVDLRALGAGASIGGRFGAMDQIFPHELAHVILVQLAGPPRRGGSNQMHAIGVRTNAFTAFHEGFAEHLQVLAVDDAEALADTRRLLRNDFFERRTAMQVREYRAELEAAWPVPGRRRIAFPLWFSGSEQALRYYAVKANAFAREPGVTPELLAVDPYSAYLIQNVIPGRPSDPPRNAAQLASTEGVIAALFVAWVTDGEIQRAMQPAAFYAPFGVAPEAVSPLDNAYLKLFHAFFVTQPADVAAAIAGYKACFPGDGAALDRIVSDISLGRSFGGPASIWLANDTFTVGTSVFDQFRNLPRVHVFDLNAASVVDLVTVPGITRQAADAVRRAAPFANVDDLKRVPGLDASLLRRFQTLERRAAELAKGGDGESSLSFWLLMRPFIWRLAVLIVAAGLLGGAAYRLALPRGWPRAIVNGIAVVGVGLFCEIALDFPAGALAIAGPLILFGIPGAVYCAAFPRRTASRVTSAGGAVPGRLRLALRVAFAWTLAALPLVVLITPHF